MARLAESIHLVCPGATVLLRPSLRAALRLAREHETFGPLLKGIGEGSVSIIGRVIDECGESGPALAPLFTVPGRSLASRITELQPIALDLVIGLTGRDDHETQPAKPAPSSAKPLTLVEQCEELFGFATGILKWTPAEAWAATPGEIIAAANFRQKVFAPADETPKKLTLDQQAMLLAARLETRAN